MKLLNILSELHATKHFNERKNRRLLYNEPYDVIITKYNPYGDVPIKIKLGEYTLPNHVFQEIHNKFQYMLGISANINPTYNFGVIMHIFHLLDEWNNFVFDKNIHKFKLNEYYQDIKKGRVRLALEDKITHTYGYIMVSIVSRKNIITTFLESTEDKKTLKRRFDAHNPNTIIIDDPHEIEDFISLPNRSSIK